jgi:hypothetical protein
MDKFESNISSSYSFLIIGRCKNEKVIWARKPVCAELLRFSLYDGD